MIGVVVMVQQLLFIRTKNLGFDKEHIVMVKLRSVTLGTNIQPLKSAFKQINGIIAVGGCTSRLAGDAMGYYTPSQNFGAKAEVQWASYVDEEYFSAMGIKLKEGRLFSANPNETLGKVIVNQTALRRWNIQGVGDTARGGMRIIGVVEDFHFSPLYDKIEPISFTTGFWKDSSGTLMRDIPFRFLAVRLAASRDYPATLRAMEKTWNEVATQIDKDAAKSGLPFEYTFLEDDLNMLYRNEERILFLVSVFGGLTLFIAALGLLGLTAFTIERRTKEIGIRKVLGASVASIVGLLSKDFLKLVVVAIVIATPLAYWAAGKWLQDFAYRVDLGAGVFVLAGTGAVLIAFATVASQAWQAARANPVHSLRSE